MNTPDWDTWLRQWMVKHPLKEPPASGTQEYTQEVMRRIRAMEAPAPMFQWVPRPRSRPVLAWATVAVFALLIAIVVPRSSVRLADRQPEETSPQNMMVAESLPASDDEAWIAQTLEVLEEVEAEDIDAWDSPQHRVTDDELLEELRLLEELEASELAASS